MVNESVIIDRYCYNNYFLKIYPFSFKRWSHLATRFKKLKSVVQVYMKSKWSLSSRYANAWCCFPSRGLLCCMFLLVLRRSFPSFTFCLVNTRLRYGVIRLVIWILLVGNYCGFDVLFYVLRQLSFVYMDSRLKCACKLHANVILLRCRVTVSCW
jgi:hypothetical protein